MSLALFLEVSTALNKLLFLSSSLSRLILDHCFHLISFSTHRLANLSLITFLTNNSSKVSCLHSCCRSSHCMQSLQSLIYWCIWPRLFLRHCMIVFLMAIILLCNSYDVEAGKSACHVDATNSLKRSIFNYKFSKWK
jgi:hypothetical protein